MMKSNTFIHISNFGSVSTALSDESLFKFVYTIRVLTSLALILPVKITLQMNRLCVIGLPSLKSLV